MSEQVFETDEYYRVEGAKGGGIKWIPKAEANRDYRRLRAQVDAGKITPTAAAAPGK